MLTGDFARAVDGLPMERRTSPPTHRMRAKPSNDRWAVVAELLGPGDPRRLMPPAESLSPLTSSKTYVNELPNPYQSPAIIDPPVGWWSKLRARWLRLRAFTMPSPRFDLGDVIICEGIAFFVDPNDSETLNAAVPSSVATMERMDLIVNEVLRILPVFLIDHPKSHHVVRGRRLVVRMVELYSDLHSDRRAPIDLGCRPIERALEN